MALFQKTENQAQESKASSKKKTIFAKTKVAVKPSVLAHRFLLRPRITEKAYSLNGANQFVFEVSRDAHKSVIARAVQEAYGVDVLDVRTVNLPGKSKVFGKNGQIGSRTAIKKAIVTIKEGQSIELFATGV